MGDIKIINGEITSISQGIEFNDTSNTASGTDSVAFGNNTTASGNFSVAFGNTTTSTAAYSFAGGYLSDATATNSFVFGNNNTVGAEQSTILGGLDNLMISTATINSSIIGGASNQVINNCDNTSIIGGLYNAITNSWATSIIGGVFNAISGSSSNSINGSTIIGGDSNIISGNTTSNALDYSTIIGGSENTIKTTTTATGARNTIVGGSGCTINGVNNSAIINGLNITLTESNTTYIGGIKRGGYVLSNTLTSAVSSSSVTPALVSGWQFTAVSGGIYKLTVIGTYQTAATTTGGRLKIGGTATSQVAGRMYGAIASTAVATELAFPATSMTSQLVTTGVSAINTPHHIGCDVIFRCTAGGTIQIEWGSEVAASAAQLNIGSSIIVERIN